jgi:hypothetical protein
MSSAPLLDGDLRRALRRAIDAELRTRFGDELNRPSWDGDRLPWWESRHAAVLGPTSKPAYRRKRRVTA